MIDRRSHATQGQTLKLCWRAPAGHRIHTATGLRSPAPPVPHRNPLRAGFCLDAPPAAQGGAPAGGAVHRSSFPGLLRECAAIGSEIGARPPTPHLGDKTPHNGPSSPLIPSFDPPRRGGVGVRYLGMQLGPEHLAAGCELLHRSLRVDDHRREHGQPLDALADLVEAACEQPQAGGRHLDHGLRWTQG